MPSDTLFELRDQRRPPRDLPILNTGSRWAAPTDLPSLKGVKRLGFDTETKDRDLKALGPGFRRSGGSKAHIVGMSLALDLDGPRMYVPVRHEGGGNLDESVVKRWAQSELQNFDGELVGGNLAYEMDGMAAPQFGVTFSKVKRFRDVLVAEPLLDEWRLNYKLNSVAKDRVGEGKSYDHVRRVMKHFGYKTEEDFVKNLWRHPASDAGEYAEGDADLPLRILDVQLKQMDLEDQEEDVHLRDVFDLECDLIPILVAMRIRGVRVDYGRAYTIKRELEAERDRYLIDLRRLAGPQAEFMAPESFAKALTEHGLEFSLTLKTKKPSITKEWLKAHSGDPIVDAVLGGRRVDYIINTFINGHIFRHSIPESEHYGRIHPTFKQLKGGDDSDEGDDDGDDTSGTIARFACRDPNLQNIPARDPYLGPLIRSMFVPEEDEDWESSDACLVGSTRVATIDGYIQIKDLVLNPVPVLSSPDAQTLCFKNITRATYIGVRPVYKIALDDGCSVKCTADHKWIDYWNNEIETRDLRPRTKLAHVKMSSHVKYPNWWMRSSFKYVCCHRLVALFELGPTPEGYEVDHKDHDPANWTRDNLQHLPKSVNHGQGAEGFWKKATDEERKNKIQQLVQGQRDNRRSYEGDGNPNAGNTGHLSDRIWVTNGTQSRRLNYVPEGWWRGRTTNNNHKVVSVEYVGEEPVYHISVEDTETFVLANGLVSHNSQIEYKYLVHFAVGRGANEARRKYNEDINTDFHVLCGDFLGADASDSFVRKRVKNTNFCKVYGGGDKKLAYTFGCSLEEAVAFSRKYDVALPFVGETRSKASKWALKRGFVTTILGRKQRFPKWERKKKLRDENGKIIYEEPLSYEQALEFYGDLTKKLEEIGDEEKARKAADRLIQRAWGHKALNRKLQGSGADHMKAWMVKAHREGCTAVLGPMLTTVHDEGNNSVPRTPEGREAAEHFRRCGETCIEGLRVPILIKSKRGASWGACE